jgi:hypothetical protein
VSRVTCRTRPGDAVGLPDTSSGQGPWVRAGAGQHRHGDAGLTLTGSGRPTRRRAARVGPQRHAPRRHRGAGTAGTPFRERRRRRAATQPENPARRASAHRNARVGPAPAPARPGAARDGVAVACRGRRRRPSSRPPGRVGGRGAAGPAAHRGRGSRGPGSTSTHSSAPAPTPRAPRAPGACGRTCPTCHTSARSDPREPGRRHSSRDVRRTGIGPVLWIRPTVTHAAPPRGPAASGCVHRKAEVGAPRSEAGAGGTSRPKAGRACPGVAGPA